MATNPSVNGTDSVVNMAGLYGVANTPYGYDLFNAVVAFLNDPTDGWHDDIFENDQFTITSKIGDAGCDAAQASRAYWELRSEFDQAIHAVIGCRCSGASNSVATVTSLENIAQVAISSTATIFSDRADDYPLFSRMVPPDNEFGQVGGLAGVLKAMGWTNVHILLTDKQFARDLTKDFRDLWESQGGTTYQAPTITFVRDSANARNTMVDPDAVRQAMESLPGLDSEQNSKIILLVAHAQDASQILDQVYAQGLAREDAVWLAPEAWAERYSPEFSPERPYPGLLGVVPLRNRNEEYADFLRRFNQYLAQRGLDTYDDLPEYPAEMMVDAIVSAAKAIGRVPADKRRDGASVVQELQKLEFDGVSGPVAFTETGDRKDPRFSIVNLQRAASDSYAWKSVGEVTVPSDGTEPVFQLDKEGLCVVPTAMGEDTACGIIPEDSTPLPKDKDSIPNYVFITSAVALVFVIATFIMCRKNRAKYRALQKSAAELQEMAEQINVQLTGVVEVKQNVPHRTSAEYNEAQQAMNDAPTTVVRWYWEEDQRFINQYPESERLAETQFVAYNREISTLIEIGWQDYQKNPEDSILEIELSSNVKKKQNAHTGAGFELNLQELKQVNLKSGNARRIQREEYQLQPDPKQGHLLPPLPPSFDEINGDHLGLLPLRVGQLIKVVREHPNDDSWAYGNVLFDPLTESAGNIDNRQASQIDDKIKATIMDAMELRRTSGWFPKIATEAADAGVMKSLAKNMGTEMPSLGAPSNWDTASNGSSRVMDGLYPLREESQEYQCAKDYFRSTLHPRDRDAVEITSIRRVQNMSLWQSYTVKLQTMQTTQKEHPGTYTNNLKGQVERKWLFHGTEADNIQKINQQGFNRSFSGRNAVAFGGGVYFARDASYSMDPAYAVPDDDGTRHMFMCRVAVGDWCRGNHGQRTPDPKPYNSFELYDSTVDDVINPSVFVVYHDAQAYPEYLLTFRRTEDARPEQSRAS